MKREENNYPPLSFRVSEGPMILAENRMCGHAKDKYGDLALRVGPVRTHQRFLPTVKLPLLVAPFASYLTPQRTISEFFSRADYHPARRPILFLAFPLIRTFFSEYNPQDR